MAITFDDIFLNIPQSWKQDPELYRFATILSRLGDRTGGGATDTIAEISAEVTDNTVRIDSVQDDVDAVAEDLLVVTSDLTTLTEDHETSIQVEDLYTRIENLERRLKQLEEDIETNGD